MIQRGLIPSLLLAILGSLFLACWLGSTPLGLERLLSAFTATGPLGDRIVVWDIRLPRSLAALAVGMALGASGAALQGLLRNPLAEPGVLGVTSAASLAATFVIYFGYASLWDYAVPVAAIAGAMAATALLVLAAFKTQSVITLILIGVGLSSFCAAVMAFLMNMAPNPFSLAEMVNWMLGSVAHRSLTDLLQNGPFICLGLGLLWVSRRGLSALTLGEEAAQAIGLNLRNQRLLVIMGAGLATGAAVALAGAIGFVGIVAPHLIRPLVQYDPARTLVPSALLGGLILILADIGVRIIPTTAELKLGVVAALVGAPAFIFIAMQRRAVHD